jgi:hypothetical protein
MDWRGAAWSLSRLMRVGDSLAFLGARSCLPAGGSQPGGSPSGPREVVHSHTFVLAREEAFLWPHPPVLLSARNGRVPERGGGRTATTTLSATS